MQENKDNVLGLDRPYEVETAQKVPLNYNCTHIVVAKLRGLLGWATLVRRIHLLYSLICAEAVQTSVGVR